MYEVEETRVLYNGKKIKADPATFEELIYEFAKDGTGIYYKGKLQPKLVASTFKILDEFYVTDGQAIWLVMERKLKAIKADSKSFSPVGFGYGRDTEQAYWKAKPIKGCKPSELFPLTEDAAMDHKSVFWESRRILKKALDRSTGRAYLSSYSLFLWDKSGVWFSEHYWEAAGLPEADSSHFRVLLGDYATDGERLYYGSKLIDGVKPENLQGVGPNEDLVTVGGVVVNRGIPLSHIDVTTFGVAFEHIFDSTQVGETKFGLTSAPTSPETWVRNLLNELFRLAACYYAIGNRTDDAELPEIDFPDYELRLEGESVVVIYGEHALTGTLDNLGDLSSRLWSVNSYGVDFTRFLHETISSYPDGDFQVKASLKTGGPELLALARERSPKALKSLTRQVLISVYREDQESYLSASSYDALSASQMQYVWSSVTTNLARAREISAQGAISHQSPMVRHKAASELYGLANATNKLTLYMKELLPPIKEQAEAEEFESLRIQWLSIIDLVMASVILAAGHGHEVLYEEALPYLSYLVEQQFNLDHNLARIVEAKLYLGESKQEAEQELRELVGDRRMAPLWSGLHQDYPNLDAWLFFSELRVLGLRTQEQRQDAMPDILSRAEELVRHWGKPEHVADLICDLEGLCEALDEPTVKLVWKEDLYTRSCCIEYVVNKMDYDITDVVTDDGGFFVRGWPWGRRIEVKVGDDIRPAFIGMRQDWPEGKVSVSVIS